jgi:midasin (ATPase involved in ribosome maturation)
LFILFVCFGRYGCRQLALEALAVISNALAQLEVGEISIMSFGARSALLHPFGSPFTPEVSLEISIIADTSLIFF